MAFRREKKRIGDMLINENVITQEQLEKALPIAKEKHKKIGETLIELGFTNELEIAKALSQQLGLELVNVSSINIPEEVQNLVSETVLRKHVMIPYAFDKNNANIVHVAMADPMDMVALDDFSIVTNLQAEPAVATGRDILLTLDKYYGDTEAMKAAQEYARERKEREQKNAEAEEATSKDVNNSPVVLLVNSIIEQAARLRASDIHIEALENKVRVRYRIDGALYEKAAYSIHLLSAIITRLKIIGGMDISEKRKPQDGRITMEIDKTEYDIRVSILPTVFGEKCVMRLAQKKALTRDKKELGFSDEELKAFDHILMNTNGIILVTGPTGSGKSTTLYTALSELNRDDVNIITVEDPVEANIDGINQVQVNNKADLTFASALRSILRQDPDIIFVVRLTTDCGMPSCCGVGTSYERIRSAAAYEPLCLNTLALTREKPSTEKAKSSSPFFFSTSLSSCGTIGESRLSVSTLVRTWFPCGTSIPSILSITGFPGAICISDEFCCCAAFKMSTICIFFSPLVFKRGL